MPPRRRGRTEKIPAPSRVELLQGSLDLIILQALATMGPQHSYGLAARLEQVAEHPFSLNQGTLYPALVRLEQKGWIKGAWQTTENNREAKYYGLTRSGRRALPGETDRWRRLVGLVEKLLLVNGGARNGKTPGNCGAIGHGRRANAAGPSTLDRNDDVEISRKAIEAALSPSRSSAKRRLARSSRLHGPKMLSEGISWCAAGTSRRPPASRAARRRCSSLASPVMSA